MAAAAWLLGGTPAGGQDLRNSYRQPAAPQGLDFRLGDSIFRKLWVQAPSSTRSSDGLGPLYNARSCAACHTRNGRGPLPQGEEPPLSLLFRTSIPPQGASGPTPEPTYGLQIQPLSVAGLRGEGRVVTTWQETPVTLADGSSVSLRSPSYRFTDPAYGAPHPGMELSPRQAPSLIGLGLLERVPEAAILAPRDNRDGIRGRPNHVWSPSRQEMILGRFGWKAAEPTLDDQVATAFANDLGLSTPLRPAPWGDCTARQPECRAAPHGLAPGEASEVAPALFDLVLAYLRNLAVPPRRDADNPQVRAGEAVFGAIGCAACHRPALAPGVAAYTDLLLHDMGPGLADGRPDGRAGGQDWRTAPLWGLGLAAAVAGGPVGYLHDGRARSPLEAILWHGGTAQPARDRVLGLSPADRAALLAFLDSL
ncbi:di-heme oxidoreductase family protein [Roseomonas sp. USHLN139]|uniref:di-heme oxidoreductase family protein n=1 Tax=Roseomonas sp. USHLN139 TaxID=3081298 RepID=UPI003B02B221